MRNNHEQEAARSAKKEESNSEITTRKLNVDRDNSHLIRLGKKPVVKVWPFSSNCQSHLKIKMPSATLGFGQF
jgi:hypothetical protein